MFQFYFTYNHGIRLIGLTISVNWTFLASCYGWGAKYERLSVQKSVISLQRGPVDQKFQVEEVALHQPFFFSEN